jgi:hypothetical protein
MEAGVWLYRVKVSPLGVVEVVDGEPYTGDNSEEAVNYNICQGRLGLALEEAQEAAKGGDARVDNEEDKEVLDIIPRV